MKAYNDTKTNKQILVAFLFVAAKYWTVYMTINVSMDKQLVVYTGGIN